MQENQKLCVICNHSARVTDPWCVNCGTDFSICFHQIQSKFIHAKKLVNQVMC